MERLFRRRALLRVLDRPEELTIFLSIIGCPEQFDQIWFAGNHADVGGSYPENESRLSDITLAWMVDFITKEIPAGGQIIVDPAVLKLYPSSDGMMHDECMVGVGGTSIRWNQAIRDVPDLRTCMLPSMNDCVCPKSETLQAMGISTRCSPRPQ